MRDSETSRYQCKDCGHKWSGFKLTKSQIKKSNIVCVRCESNNIKRLGLKFQHLLIIYLSVIPISGLIGGIIGMMVVDNANLNTFLIGFGIGCFIGLLSPLIFFYLEYY